MVLSHIGSYGDPGGNPSSASHPSLVFGSSFLPQDIPTHLGINIELRYATLSDIERLSLNSNANANEVIDSVLTAVYEANKRDAAAASQDQGGRRIVFSSFNPLVATALNWKQPNCECLTLILIWLTAVGRRRFLRLLLRPLALSTGRQDAACQPTRVRQAVYNHSGSRQVRQEQQPARRHL
jgi:hypothetical protein